MNTLIEFLNHWGDRFAGFALPMLLQSSLLIGGLLVLDFALRRHVRAAVRYALWLLVLVKLVLPPSLALPTGLGYWLAPTQSVAPPPPMPTTVIVRYSDVPRSRPPSVMVTPPAPVLKHNAVLMLAWVGGVLGLLGVLLVRSEMVRRKVATATEAPEDLTTLLDECRRQLGLRRRVRLKIADRSMSPAVCGLWRPVVMLPRPLATGLSLHQLRAVLLHELAHLQRGDLWVNYAQTLLQIFYWWHPLLWLANARIRRVREQAVDERVMVALGQDTDTYPSTLLEVAKLCFTRPLLNLGLVGIIESKSALKQRIGRLLNGAVPKSAKLGRAGAVTTLFVAAFLLPMARGERRSSSGAAGHSSVASAKPASLTLEVRFVAVRETELGKLTLARPTSTLPNGHRAWVMTSERLKALIQRLEQQPGIDIVAAPRVTTLDGCLARIRPVGVVRLQVKDVEVGPVCDLTPHIRGKQIDLVIAAKVTEALKPGSSLDGAYSINATGYLQRDVGTARVTIEDGGSVLLHNPAAQDKNGNRYLVLVSGDLQRTIRPEELRSAREELADLLRSYKQAHPKVRAQREKVRRLEAQSGLSVRVFKVDPKTFTQGLERNWPSIWTSKPPESQGGTPTDLSASVRRVFEACGAKPETVFFNDRTGMLMVRATAADFEVIETTIEAFSRTPPQLMIETKFTEISQDDSKALGFDWILGNTLLGGGRMGVQAGTAPSYSSPTTSGPPAHPSGMFPGPGVPTVAAPSSAQSTPAEIAEREALRREQQKMLLRIRLNEAQSAQSKKHWEESARLYEEACDLSRQVGAGVESDTRKAVAGLVATRMELARLEESHGLPENARANLNRILNVDSRNAEALAYKERIDQAIEAMRPFTPSKEALAQVPEVREEKVKMAKLIQDARLFIEMGKLDEAQSNLERVIKLDPSNKTAYTYMNIIQERQATEAARKSALVAKEAMVEIATAKHKPIQREKLGAANPFATTNLAWTTLGRQKIKSKLERIMVKETPKFDATALSKVVTWLRDTSLQGDPEKEGINFLVNNNLDASTPAPTSTIDPNTGLPVPGPTPERINVSEVQITLNPPLMNVKLSEVLDAITMVADKQIKYTIEEWAVMFSQRIPASPQLFTRIYKVDPDTFRKGLESVLGVRLSQMTSPTNTGSAAGSTTFIPPAFFPASPSHGGFGGGGGIGQNQPTQEAVRSFFEAAGVSFTPPSQNTLFYKDRTGVLMVQASAQEHEIIETAIAVIHIPPPQIMIEAKFVWASAAAVDKVDFGMPITKDTNGVCTWLLTEPKARALLKTIEQAGGFKVLAAPKVSTLSERQAQIQVAEPLPTGGQATNLVLTLDVVPTVAADGYTVGLTQTASLTEKSDDTGPKGPSRFEASTRVNVWDGQTVVVGGPIKATGAESNAAGSNAQHLLVLVTPVIIDPAGNPVHTLDNPPYPADKTAPQPETK